MALYNTKDRPDGAKSAKTYTIECMMSLPDLTFQTIHQHKMVPLGSKLVVGVSGGADSLALLHVLHTKRTALGVELHAATFDHGLRGPDGAADAAYVAQICRSWGIPVIVGAASVKSQGGGIEQAARKARYDFLAHTAHTLNAQHIAVAHHADDQAETVLLNLIRGTGLRGLGGMALSSPLPGHPDLTLIRPFLQRSRQEIETYCRDNNLHPRHDATNEDTRFVRNHIRLETLPMLRQMNPHIDQALVRLAAIAQTDHDFIANELQTRISDTLVITPDRVTLPQETFRELPPALQNQFILYAIQQLGGKDTGFEHVHRAVDLALRGHTGQVAVLPRHLRLRVGYDTIIVEKPGAPAPYDGPLLPAGTVIDMPIPGTTPLPDSDWALTVSLEPLDTAQPQAKLAISKGQRVQLRTRQAGDRFKPFGLGGHTQKIKKWMIDHKIPQTIRDQIPLLTINGEIAAFMVNNQWVTRESLDYEPQEQLILYTIFTQWH